MDLVVAKKPPYTEEQLLLALERMMDDALSKGMTSVHDAQLMQEYVPYYQKCDDPFGFHRGLMTPTQMGQGEAAENAILLHGTSLTQVTSSKVSNDTQLHCTKRDGFCGDAVGQIEGAQDGRFTMRAVKLFADGALGSRGAALFDDYSDLPGWRGFLLSPEEVWGPLVKAWYDAVSVVFTASNFS